MEAVKPKDEAPTMLETLEARRDELAAKVAQFAAQAEDAQNQAIAHEGARQEVERMIASIDSEKG